MIEAKTHYSNLLESPVHTWVTKRHTSLESFLAAEQLNRFPIIQMNQVHGAHVVEITGPSSQTVIKTDAIFTLLPEIILCVRTADCLPILITHPAGLIAAIHAGRRSTQAEIIRKTIRLAKERIGTSANPFTFWMGPCICKHHYEINPETGETVDLIGQNEAQIQAELPPEQIQIRHSNLCTITHNDRFYSYRKEGTAAGRFYSLIQRQN